jgi:endonuclease/exonuclease/phosphatase family metal-dependent hydrolase
MKATRIAFSVLLCLVCIGSAQAKVLRIATLNALNYGTTDRWVNGKYRKNYPKPEDEKTVLRQVIAEIHPDIIVFQEMGGSLFLEELQRDLLSEGVEYPYGGAYQAKDPDRCLAYLAKEKPNKVFLHHSLHFEYGEHTVDVKRGLLQIDFTGEHGPWTLFDLHLKSPAKYKNKENRIPPLDNDPRFKQWRSAEAEVLANVIKDWDSVQPHITLNNESDTSTHYVILGDFNDSPKSPALLKFLKISKRITAKDKIGHTWTYMLHTKEKDIPLIIDHVLLSPSLYQQQSEPQAHIEEVNRNQTRGSDHRMVYIDLDV